MAYISFLRSAGFGLFLLLPVSAGWANVKVTHKAAEVQHKTFDHNKPPKDLLGDAKEAAITVSEFDFQIGLSYAPGVDRQLGNGKWQRSTVIAGVTIAVGLKVTVWLPDDAPAKLKAHEEGHRQMTEKVYAERADKAAKVAGGLIDGRRITVEAETAGGLDNSFDAAINDVVNTKVHPAYLATTRDASARAGDIYDEITQHGTRMDIDEKTAAAQAFDRLAREIREIREAATTKPATRPAGKEGDAPFFK